MIDSEEIKALKEKIEQLEKQLKEANKTIKFLLG